MSMSGFIREIVKTIFFFKYTMLRNIRQKKALF